MVKVSIIMPMYNQEKYIVECLSSVVRQTLKEIEIIVVNDGSTDRSLELVRNFADKDGRIVIIDKPNSGYGHSMNVGIARATGEYIGIVETDDYVEEDMFKDLYEAAKSYGDVDIVKSDFCRFSGEHGYVVRKAVKLSEKKGYYNRVICPLQEREVFRFPMNTWTGIYRRDFLQKYGIKHNETPGASYQDNGFWFQTFCFARSLVLLDRAYYMNRRDNPNSSVYHPGKVYCVCDEYSYIAQILDKHPAVKAKIIGYYWLKKYHNYVFTLHRIAYMYKKEFVLRMQKEFAEGELSGQLDRSVFTEKERAELSLLREDAERFLEEADIAAGENPVLSAVLVKTGENFLRTFESVANQKFGKIQIICVGKSFTDAELDRVGKDERTTVLAQDRPFADLVGQAMSLVQGDYLHILASGTILDATMYSSVVKNLEPSAAEMYVCGTDLCFSDEFIRADLRNFNTDFLFNGMASPAENEALLFAVGVSLNNKVFRLSMIRRQAARLFSFDANGNSPFFVLHCIAASRYVCYENECLVKKYPSAAPTDYSALLEEYEKSAAALCEFSWVQKPFVNLFAQEVYTWLAAGGEGEKFVLEHAGRIRELVSLTRFSRECYFNGYVYDLLLKVLYSARPPQQLQGVVADHFNAAEVYIRTEAPYVGERGASYGAFSEELQQQMRDVVAARDKLAGDYRAITESVSFRVGRMITYLPRKVRDTFREDRKAAQMRDLETKLHRADERGSDIIAGEKPLVSIVMPLYNVAKYLEECLDSLLNQTYQNIEIICVDDGSQDVTCQIAERYAKEYPNIRLYRQEHLFAGVARNTGFDHVNGKYTIFLDSDDFFEPDFVRSLVVRAESTRAEVVVCRCRGFDNTTGKFFGMNWSVHEQYLPLVPVFPGRATGKHFFFAFMGWAWDKMYLTDFVRKSGLRFQDLRSSNDAFFTFTSLAVAKKISFVDKVLINQRRNLKTSISQTRSQSWDNCLLAADKIYEEWRKTGLYRGKMEQAFCNWFVQFVCWHYYTLDEEAKAKLSAVLPRYIQKYRLFERHSRFYYMQMDYERFRSITQ